MALSTGIKWLIGGAAAAAAVGIAVAASKSSTPATTPGAPPPAAGQWTIVQGERYRVTLSIVGGLNGAIDFTSAVQTALNLVEPGAYRVASSSVVNGNLVYVVDALAPTHVETAAGFASLQNMPGAQQVASVEDLGPSPVGALGPAPTPGGGTTPVVAPLPPGPAPPAAGGVILTPGQPYTITGPIDPNLPGPAFAASVQAGLSGAGATGPNWTGVQVTLGGSTFSATATYSGPPQVVSASTLPPGWTVTPGTVAAPPTPATSSAAQWVANGASDLPAGARVRVTVPLSAYVAVDPNAQPTLGGLRERFAAFIAQPNTLFSSALGPPFVWSPGDALPTDWPIDDANAVPTPSATTTGFHFEFVNTFSTPISALDLRASMWGGASGPAPDVWIAQGQGQAAATRSSTLTWSNAPTLSPGDHVRASLHPTDLLTLVGFLFAGASSPAPFSDNSCATLLGVVELSAFHALVGPGGVLAWCGIDFLPPDWPAQTGDDLSTQYHIEFRYTGASAIQTASLPLPILAFVASGLGA
jgi:hypothetical protein